MHRVTLVTMAVCAALLAAPTGSAAAAPPSQPAGAQAVTAIDLNEASVAELERLPGVGAKTAERIVEYRENNGAFAKVEDLMKVRGVGEKSFLKLRHLITVKGPKAERSPQS